MLKSTAGELDDGRLVTLTGTRRRTANSTTEGELDDDGWNSTLLKFVGIGWYRARWTDGLGTTRATPKHQEHQREIESEVKTVVRGLVPDKECCGPPDRDDAAVVVGCVGVEKKVRGGGKRLKFDVYQSRRRSDLIVS
ncbi:hypothetical protein Q3G72_035095 [Acer saccharum]|nr:hypothetical protein Q3G72_035095 [Acer saccharum]